VHSLDYDVTVRYNRSETLDYDGQLDLVKAVINKFHPPQGFHLFLHSDVPPGSGLGSSSSLMVALSSLMVRWLGWNADEYAIARTAYELERIELGIKGGMQDQYAAAFGGFNFIEFSGKDVIVNPLRIRQDIVDELQYHLLLCYTGATRLSSGIIEAQVRAYVQEEEAVMDALDELKQITVQMKNCLLKGHVQDFGDLLHAGWVNKKKLAAQITNPTIDEMYEAARRAGALGGKLLGAGGGGYLLLYCPYLRKHLVAEAVSRLGAQVAGFMFEPRGVTGWSVEEGEPEPATSARHTATEQAAPGLDDAIGKKVTG
jgi:D-glycero-alpha-D-manno-heptose-7-phosphate kinase